MFRVLAFFLASILAFAQSTPWAPSSYTAPGAGSYAISQTDYNKRTVSLFDKFSPAQRKDWTARTESLDLTTAIQAAIDANYYGTLYLPPGGGKTTAALKILAPITIIGASGSFLMGAPYTWSCYIHNTSTNTPAIEVGPATYVSFHNGVRLSSFGIKGNGSGISTPNGNTDIGLLVSGAGQHIFEYLNIWSCGGAGFQTRSNNDKWTLRNSVVSFCSGPGVNLVQDAAGGFQINSVLVERCEITTNFGNGINLAAHNAVLRSNTIQGNTGYGIYLSTTDITSQICFNNQILDNYFEFNVLGNIYGMAFANTRTLYYQGLIISGNFFTATAATIDINLTCTGGSASYHPYRGTRILNNTFSSSVVHIALNGFHGYSTLVDIEYQTGAFATNYTGFGTASPNAPQIVNPVTGRTSAGAPAVSAHFVHEKMWDTSGNRYWTAVAVGGGAADWK